MSRAANAKPPAATAPLMAWTPPGYSAAESAVMHVGRNHEPGGGRHGCYDGGGGSRKGHFRSGPGESRGPSGRTEATDTRAVHPLHRRAERRYGSDHGGLWHGPLL